MVIVTNLHPLGDWAADLRISLPVSKALLIGQQPNRGFLTEEDCLRFSDQIAIKLRRPALHDHIAVDMTRSLEALIRRERVAGAAWMDRVEQIRVRVTLGDRITPQALELIVITIDEPLSAAEKESLRKWRTGQVKDLRQGHRREALTASHPPAQQSQRAGLQRIGSAPS